MMQLEYKYFNSSNKIIQLTLIITNNSVSLKSIDGFKSWL